MRKLFLSLVALLLMLVATGSSARLQARPPLCPMYNCPVYVDYGCSCEWVWCTDHYECGVPWS